MGHYDVKQVCLNGHQITDNYNRSPEFRKNFCPTCGEKTIHQCPECQHPIKGDYHVDGVIAIGTSEPDVPIHCENCGKPFPWTLKKKELSQLISESNGQNSLKLVEQICSRFHLVAKQLKSRYSGRKPLEINDEYDTQYLLHALLQIYFNDIRPEEWAPSYAGSGSRVDFLLKEEQIIIEVKKTRKNLTAKQIGEQLIVDIEKYQNHQDCKKLICFVYDPDELISNPIGLENDLARNNDDFIVKVFIVPKR